MIGVVGSNVIVNVPVVGEVNVNVLVLQVISAPDAPVVMLPDSVPVNEVGGPAVASLGIVKVTFSVNAALLKVEVAVEVALNTPKVMFDDVTVGGSKTTLISFGLELNVMVVPPTVIALPSALIVPPEVNLPDVFARRTMGAADAETTPNERSVIAPSSKSVGRLSNRIIVDTPDKKWTREGSSSAAGGQTRPHQRTFSLIVIKNGERTTPTKFMQLNHRASFAVLIAELRK